VAKARVIANDDEVSPEAERMADLNEQEGGDLYRAIEEARSTQGAEVILTRTMPADKAGFKDAIRTGNVSRSFQWADRFFTRRINDQGSACSGKTGSEREWCHGFGIALRNHGPQRGGAAGAHR
jgi:hypothetical protein